MPAETDTDLHFQVNTADAGEHLDRLVARAAQVSRRVARTWIATGRVSVGNKPLRILTKPMRAGLEISIRRTAADAEPRAATAAPVATGRPTGSSPETLRVLFVDRYLLVLDKPARLLTEQDRFGSPAVESIAPTLLAKMGERGGRTRVWLVHRLDAGTSGVVVLARTPMAAKALGEAFRTGTVHKTYFALCKGRFVGTRTLDAAIARAERTRHVVSAAGKPARTLLVGVAATEVASLVRAEPETGRTHQIRVHLTHLGHPLLGDGLYGGPMYTQSAEPQPIGRPMLHAARIVFPHPKTGAPTEFRVAPPADFATLAAALALDLPVDEGR